MSEQSDAAAEQEFGFTLADVWAILQLQRRVVLACFVAGLLVAAVWSGLATRYYTAVAVVQLSPIAGQEISSDRVVDDLTAQWNRAMFVSTQVGLLESRLLRTKVLEAYAALGHGDGVGPDDAGIGLLKGATQILPRKNTELIDIKVTSTDPELSATLANLTAKVFKEENLAANTDAARDAHTWLTEQLGEYEQRIKTASRDLVDYEREHDMVDADQDENSLGARMSTLNGTFAEANRDRVVQETLVRSQERLLREGNYEELAKAMNTPLIVSLTSQYATAVTEHARVAAVLGEKTPERRASEAQLARIESELRAEVESQLSAERARLALLRAKEKDLQAEIAGGKEEMLRVQELSEDYVKRQLELESARAFYQRLRERMGELELQSKTQLNRVRVIEEAQVPDGPSYPVVPLNLAVGLLGGLALGLGLAFVREWLDDTVSSPLDVTTYLRVPFLGVIPKIQDELDEVELALHTHRHPRSTVAEALRGVRTLLELNPLGDVPKRILITSAVSSEGKTSTVIRLAIAFANLNRKVLVVDADLRRPRVHKVFAGDREPGLTTVLGDNTPPEDAIRPTEVPNLSYLAAGSTGERPNELLASNEVKALLDRVSKDFDLVIIDSPPSVILSDARILSRYVDGVVLVVLEHATSRALVREATQSLDQVGARMLGVVINAVDFSRRRTSYKYYYGYGYRYDRYYEEAPKDVAAK